MRITFDAEIKSFELKDHTRVLISFVLVSACLHRPELDAIDGRVGDIGPLTMTVHRKAIANLKLGQKFKIELGTDCT
jgi:hypothetical protein